MDDKKKDEVKKKLNTMMALALIKNLFSKGQISYKTSLLITWIAMAVVMFIGQFLVSILFNLCSAIPF